MGEQDTRDPTAEIEERLSRLHRRLGIEGDPLPGGRARRLSPEVLALVDAGRTADAARLHRDQVGCDLPTAVAAVAATARA
jgi:hypothetical protein